MECGGDGVCVLSLHIIKVLHLGIRVGQGPKPPRGPRDRPRDEHERRRTVDPGCVEIPDTSGDGPLVQSNGNAFKSMLHFSLPSTSDVLYFFNNGSLAHGVIEIVTQDDVAILSAESPDILVDMTVAYGDPSALDLAEVCMLEEQSGERGLAIVVSHF